MENLEKNSGVNKSVINWLITIYSNFLETPLFIKVCED